MHPPPLYLIIHTYTYKFHVTFHIDMKNFYINVHGTVLTVNSCENFLAGTVVKKVFRSLLFHVQENLHQKFTQFKAIKDHYGNLMKD